MSLHHQTPDPQKGARYLGLLDQALCNGSWNEVPELARKVDKHAPGRNGLTLAARAEAQIAAASHRPTSASSATSTSIHSLSGLIPGLVEAILLAEKLGSDDAYVASTCLAEIHWLQEAPLEALKILSETGSPSLGSGSSGIVGWEEVCAVKCNVIKAACLDASSQHNEARECYQSVAVQTPGYRTPELRRWTERLLASACMYSVKKIPSPSLQDFSQTYPAFRAWGDFWQRAPSTSTSVSTYLDISRRQVWKAYYDLVSTILQHDLLLNPTPKSLHDLFVLPSNTMSEEERTSVKRRQRAEIKRVESMYESLLFNETKFPKASETNTEVEEWVEQAVTNWRIQSGPSWTDADLGEGGRRAMSRNVLDILYRAATKTFHSTAVLRLLFTIHAALGEFDLAMDAFDSYWEIINNGKARLGKTGKHETGFDDEDTAILTASEAVRMLCRYGDRKQAEKAREVSRAIQKWLDQQRPTSGSSHQPTGDDANGDAKHSSRLAASSLQPETLAAAYRAIGISHAHWASLTYESESRAALLADASFHLLQSQKYGPDNVDTAHALALVLGQTRDVSGALDVIQKIIGTQNTPLTSNSTARPASTHERERRLISLWHLLALCMTAQDEYERAFQMCEAAYKQFGTPQVLFGSSSAGVTTGDPEKPAAKEPVSRGIVDQMEGFEKEALFQVKMTQIMLFELMEGAEEAIDMTDGLLSLYSRLFGTPERVVAEAIVKPPPTAASRTPSRLGGTLRSITGSIRPKSSRSVRSDGEKDSIRRRSITSADDSLAIPASHERPVANGQALGPPISITVTNEDGTSPRKAHHHHPHLPHLPFQGRGRRSASMGSRTPSKSIAEKDETKPLNQKATTEPARAAVNGNLKPDQPLGEMAHTEGHNQWPSTRDDDQPPYQDVRLPVPESHLSPIHDRRHKITVLVQTWIFSAELYIRADSYDDAQNLINDAFNLTESLELQLTKSEDGANARRLFQKGWGSGKSIDELWADVWSTKAHLAAAYHRPYDAMAAYEQALAYYPDHSAGIVGLSNLLLDIYEEKIPAEQPVVTFQPLPSASGSLINEAKPAIARPTSSSTIPSGRASILVDPESIETKERKLEPSPAELNRLAARDRAYMLLSNLTKNGAGWDHSEAWYTLARAHELSREIGKAKQALWWVVELEDSRPIRAWKEATPGGYTL